MRSIAVAMRRRADWLAETHDNGTTSVEYALIAVLIAVVIVSVVMLLGTNVSSFFSEINGAFH